MEQFETIDVDNNICQFQYSVEYSDKSNPSEVYFRVFSIPENPLRWFSYILKIIDHKIAKSEIMTINDNLEFAKKGIPEKMIEIASLLLKRKIISSPIIPKAGDFLIGSSTITWESLVKNNKNASLNEKRKCFELNYNPNN
jgi:hypothetical protein